MSKIELSLLGKIIWEDRYGLKDKQGNLIEKSIIDTFRRVAKAIASKEKKPSDWEKKFFSIMSEGYFCPAGRILAHAGTSYSQLLNCFVLPFRDDSLEEIMHTASDMAVVQKYAGGTGFNYSNLRPEGSYIKGVNGRSCGVIGFLSMMSTISEVIEQGGSRRGANLGLLEVDHPDIWDYISYKTEHSWEHLQTFVDVKDEEKWASFTFENMYKWQMYNVSVALNDEFLDALRSDADWKFTWKNTEWKLHKVVFRKFLGEDKYKEISFEVLADNEKTAIWKAKRRVPFPTSKDVFSIDSVRTVKASEVWNKICYNAWADGCPGLINMSTIKKMHNLEYAHPILSANPCLHGNSLLLTEKGLQPISLLVDKKTLIWNGTTWSEAEIICTGIKPVYRAQLSNGMFVEGTKDHILFAHPENVSGKDEEIYLGNSLDRSLVRMGGSDWQGYDSGLSEDELQCLGFIFGDGTYHKKSSRYKYIYIGEKDEDLKDLFMSIGEDLEDGPREDSKCINAKTALLCKKLNFPGVTLPYRVLPYDVMSLSSKNLCLFLRGLFSANGCVHEKYKRISLKITNKESLERLQIILMALNMKSYRTINKKHKVTFRNGTYMCRESYDLNISSEDLIVFREKIGFIQRYKKESLDKIVKELKLGHRSLPKVTSIDYIGEEFVYDFKEPLNHFGFVNGLKIHNCAEQPLPAMGCCLLASLNLPSFVKDGEVDSNLLKEVIHTAVRFMDNVIDNCDFPLKEIGEMENSERRIGLGTMGVHDLLIALKKDYDSETGRALVEDLLKFIRNETYLASIEIAKEKGSFPVFDKDKYLESGFIKTLPEDIIRAIANHGIRNSCLLSQAPTGTIGSMYNVSTGCEPWFALAFDRNTRLGSYEDGCPAYLEWKKTNSGSKPSWFKTSQEISPEDHVRMMIVFNKYMDSSVSKTINLPGDATVDDVRKTFLMAMENGIKGVTVFRDGCKKAVLVKKEEKPLEPVEEKIAPTDLDEVTPADTRMTPKLRGNRTVGATTRIHFDKHNMYITANKNPMGDLVEIFAIIGESKEPAVQHTSGVEDSWAEALGKIISLALRAGVTPDSIIRNLKNIPSDKPVFSLIGDCENAELIPSPPHAIGRVMEEELKYKQNILTKMEDFSRTGILCDNCGSSQTLPKGPNCYRCLSCGHEECGGRR